MFNKDELVYLWLDCFDGLTYKKKEQILNLEKNPSCLLDNFLLHKSKIKDIVDNDLFFTMESAFKDKNFLELRLKELEKLDIVAITLCSKDYPEKLKHIDCPPFVLYCKGNIDLLNHKSIAIVGTRKASTYGKIVTEKLAKDLSLCGFVIASGLALGIDEVAHRTALKNKCKTIAVLAGGLNEIYPPMNTGLATEIVKNGGLLVSELRPYFKLESFYFPIRNRIIAGLSDGVVIAEASIKSGAMHTKNYALDFGREVFAVPGNITSELSNGCNNLILRGEAKIVTCSADIFEEFNIKLEQMAIESLPLSENEKLVLEKLGCDEVDFQTLQIKTKLETKTLNSLLTTMSIRGIIKKVAGNIYCKL